MKVAQLIKKTENHLYKDKNGEILNLTADQKIMHSIFSPELCVVQHTEEVIDRFRYRFKKEVDVMYWDYINKTNSDPRDFYIVFTDN